MTQSKINFLNDPDTNKISFQKVKCANCGGNHTANYSGCPKRIEFKQIQDSIRDKNLKQKRSKQLSFADAVKSDTIPSQVKSSKVEDFPPLPQSTQQSDPVNSNADTFSNDEIMQITKIVFQRLKSCKSKEEQLLLIFEVTAQFVFPE